MASRLQDVILRGLAADRPLPVDVAPGTLYHSTDVQVTERCSDDNTTWETYSDAGLPGTPLHAPTHSLGGTDPVDVTDLAGFPGGVADFLRADATFAPLVVGIHATNHSLAGTDPVDVKNLAGYTGVVNDVLRGNATFVPLPAVPVRFGALGMLIDGAGAAIAVGLKGYMEVPFACTIVAVTLLADQTGSIVIDIWKDTYAAFPPVVADTITAAAKPTISAAIKSQDVTLTGWNTTINAGDILAFNVDSAATIVKLNLTLKVQMA